MPKVEIKGLNRFRKALVKLGAEDLPAAIKATNLEAAQIVEQHARPNVPSRTGRLQGSLRSSGTLGAGIVRIGKASVPYAGNIHFGDPFRPHPGSWGGPISPNTFLYEALDARASEVFDLYMKRIDEIVEAVGE